MLTKNIILKTNKIKTFLLIIFSLILTFDTFEIRFAGGKIEDFCHQCLAAKLSLDL